MAMCVVVTRDVPLRFRGFLASCMLEISSGVYAQPDMSAAVRERVRAVLDDWWSYYQQGSVVMTWPTPGKDKRQEVWIAGEPAKEILEYEEVHLVRREMTKTSRGGARRRPSGRSWPR